MNDNPYEERDRTGFHEGMDPKAIAYNVSLDMATLLVGHMDGYCLSSDNPFAPVDHYPPEHAGAAPIRIDKYLGDVANDIVKLRRVEEQTMGGAILFQEEAIQTSYVAAEDDRRYRIVVDPLDGSTIYSAFGVGCVSVLVYFNNLRDQSWQLQGGCIALNNGYAFTYTLESRIYQPRKGMVRAQVSVSRFLNKPLEPKVYRPVEFIERSVDIGNRTYEGKAKYVLASTAGSPERRTSIEKTIARHDDKIGFLGSFAANLSIWGAVLGKTSVIIDPSPSTMHDGNYLMMLQALNWIVLDAASWTELPLLHLAEKDCDPHITREQRIPPIYAFRNDEVKDQWTDGNRSP